VKAIVEGYGGSVTAATKPDDGAQFTVRLPVV
jgi:signal transduction histidine kinase